MKKIKTNRLCGCPIKEWKDGSSDSWGLSLSYFYKACSVYALDMSDYSFECEIDIL